MIAHAQAVDTRLSLSSHTAWYEVISSYAMASPPGYPGMERWRGKVALVTGASAGIGYTTAKQLTELGINVVGCARNIGTIEVST